MQETETWVWSLSREDPLEKGMITHSSILAWRIPWIQEPGRLQSMTSHRVGHDWVTNTFAFIFDVLWSIIFPFSFVILIWALSLFSLDESSKWFTNFIFSKNQLFVSLIFYIVFFAPSGSHSCRLHLPRTPCSSSGYMWPSLLSAGTCGPVSYEVTVFSPVPIFPAHIGHCTLQEWNFCFSQSCGVPVFKPCWSSKPNVPGAPPSDARASSWRAWRGTWNSYRRTSVI